MSALVVFPVDLVWSEGKQKWEKRPATHGQGWKDYKATTQEMSAAKNFGVVVPDGKVFFDLDLHKGVTRDKVEAALGCSLDWDSALMQKTVSGGEHYCFDKLSFGDIPQGQDVLNVTGFDIRSEGKGWIASGEGYVDCTWAGLVQELETEAWPKLPDDAYAALVKGREPRNNVVALVPGGGLAGDLVAAAAIDAAKPLDGIDLEAADLYLARLDASWWASQDNWLMAGMALHHQFAGSVEARSLWMQHAVRGEGYAHEDQSKHVARWNSFANRGGLLHPVKFASVIAAGGGRMALPISEEAAASRREAQREAARKIGEGVVDDQLPDLFTESEMLARFVLLTSGSRVYDMERPQELLDLADFKNLTAASVVPVGTGRFNAKTGAEIMKDVPVSTLWLKSQARKHAFSTTFKAGGGAFCEDPNGSRCVNSWAGWKQWDSDGGDATPFVDHVRWLFKDRADDFLDWLAHAYQKPEELVHTCWLHIATYQGMGRNWMASVLGRVFSGYAALALDLVGVLESGFNSRLSRKVLCVVDELREGGQNKWAHAEVFKQMINAEVREINPKFGRRSLEFNIARWLLFSNWLSAVPMGDSDRRYEVVISDAAPLDADYYSGLYALTDSVAFIGAVADFLMNRDISRFNPGGRAKFSAAKAHIVRASKSDEQVELEELFENYPFELITVGRLAASAGVMLTPQNARVFARTAEEAGWIKVGVMRGTGKAKSAVYARRGETEKWENGDTYAFKKGLPDEDGGLCGTLMG